MLILLAGCSGAGATQTPAPAATSVSNSGDQSLASHASDTDPNYAVVFPQDAVNRIDITLTSEAWSDLQSEMEEQFGQQGVGNSGGPAGQPGGQGGPDVPGGQQPPQGNFPQGNRPGNGDMRPMTFGETSYVSSTVTFDGETWEHVGFRYSGNSTLQTSWRSGTKKISFRLDFDEYEDDFPATKNQRFYGFKQLSFKSNAMDDSYLREKVTADIFREAGVVASQTAFYEVYVDTGEGPKYFGLYTVVEIVDDTVIKTQFAETYTNPRGLAPHLWKEPSTRILSKSRRMKRKPIGVISRRCLRRCIPTGAPATRRPGEPGWKKSSM
jgi:hypothetical protein